MMKEMGNDLISEMEQEGEIAEGVQEVVAARLRVCA